MLSRPRCSNNGSHQQRHLFGRVYECIWSCRKDSCTRVRGAATHIQQSMCRPQAYAILKTMHMHSHTCFFAKGMPCNVHLIWMWSRVQANHEGVTASTDVNIMKHHAHRLRLRCDSDALLLCEFDAVWDADITRKIMPPKFHSCTTILASIYGHDLVRTRFWTSSCDAASSSVSISSGSKSDSRYSYRWPFHVV